MSWYSDQQLMKKPAEDKHPRTRRVRTPTSSYQRLIKMPSHEMINRLIPHPPVSPHARTIPPFRVEFPIAESHHLGQGIESGLEDGEETGEPDYETDGG